MEKKERKRKKGETIWERISFPLSFGSCPEEEGRGKKKKKKGSELLTFLPEKKKEEGEGQKHLQKEILPFSYSSPYNLNREKKKEKKKRKGKTAPDLG